MVTIIVMIKVYYINNDDNNKLYYNSNTTNRSYQLQMIRMPIEIKKYSKLPSVHNMTYWNKIGWSKPYQPKISISKHVLGQS